MNPLKDDFRNFLYVIWKHLGLPPPTRAQYDIALFLMDRSIRRKIIEAFRGIGKSWITSAYVLWRLYNDADYKALVVSASKTRSDDFSAFTKRLINEVPFLQYLKARDDQRDSMVAFDVAPAKPAHAPSVKSMGIFGMMTGSRAVEVIGDDIEVVNNSWTQDMREKLFKTAMEFEAIIMPEVGQVTYLGTPQTEESMYNKLPQRGYKRLIIPARFPHPDKLAIYQGDLVPWIEEEVLKNPKCVGKATDPNRFTDVDLMEREAAYGRSGFSLQFMLDTTLSDAEKYPLKTSDLIVMPTAMDKAPISLAWAASIEHQLKEFPNVGFTGDRFYKPLFVDKEWTKYEGSALFIDPSGRGTDETSYAVIKQLHGKLFLRKCGGFRGGYEDSTLVQLAKVAKEEQVNYCLIESNFGDGLFTKVFTPILTRYHPCTTEEVRSHIQKELRIIDALEPVMNQHKLIVDYDVIVNDLKTEDVNYQLFYQLTRLTKERGALKHDDRLDVLALGVGYWADALARDENKAVDSYKQAQEDEELKVFMKHVLHNPLGSESKLQDTWFGNTRIRG